MTYGVIPARHRILWVNCVDLVWNAILASMSQKKEEPVKIITKDDESDQQQPMIWETSTIEETLVDTQTEVSLALTDGDDGSVEESNKNTKTNFQNDTLVDQDTIILNQ